VIIGKTRVGVMPTVASSRIETPRVDTICRGDGGCGGVGGGGVARR